MKAFAAQKSERRKRGGVGGKFVDNEMCKKWLNMMFCSNLTDLFCSFAPNLQFLRVDGLNLIGGNTNSVMLQLCANQHICFVHEIKTILHGNMSQKNFQRKNCCRFGAKLWGNYVSRIRIVAVCRHFYCKLHERVPQEVLQL